MEPVRSRCGRVFSIVIPGLLLAGCVAGGLAVWRKGFVPASEASRYETAVVERGGIEELVAATGTIQPHDYVDVGTQVSGQLKKINVEIGSAVRVGDLLAEIDPTVYRANVDARRALLRHQTAIREEREAQLYLTELQFARQKSLSGSNAASLEALQIAEANMRVARAQLASVQALIEQTQSALRADEANLDYAKIYAPMDGIVVSISARQGQTLNAAQQTPVILRIADLSTMTVQAQVSEGDVSRLRSGMDVYFSTFGSEGERWHGKLRRIEPTPTVTNNVVLYNALFDVANDGYRLLPQMTAQVFFVSSHASDALVVPAPAVTMRSGDDGHPSEQGPAQEKSAGTAIAPPVWRQANGDEGKVQAAEQGAPLWDGIGAYPPRGPRMGSVRVVRADGSIEARTVRIGINNRKEMQILSGLEAGERVVVGGQGGP